MTNIKENTLVFEISQNLNQKSICTELSKRYTVVKENPIKAKLLFLDTFDWRIYNKGFLLIKESDNFILKNKSSEQTVCTVVSKSVNDPSFWWDFEKSSLKDELRPILDLRALMPIVSIQRTSLPYRLLNKDEKNVLRLNFETIKPKAARNVSFKIDLLTVRPLRGYYEELAEINKHLNTIGLIKTRSDYFDLLLKISGRKPSEYSSKLNINLQPGMSSKTALIKILKHLLNTIKQNEVGIKKDIDTEFLHDFRVAVRRTRSALTLIRGVFDKEILSIHKAAFSKLAKATNPVRDLDVYLSKQQQYKDMIPPYQHRGLELIFEKLSEERKTEYTKLKRFLNSQSYKKIINDWESFLNTEPQSTAGTENSDTRVIVLAKKIIRKKYKQIVTVGKKIGDLTPDSELHRLRIECKKLRYLLEFFFSLFPKNEIGSIIKHLKKLQDNLGNFNDLCVQQQSLREFSEKFDSGSKNITISTGGLIAVLYQKQNETRKEFTNTFKQFVGDENSKLFNKLFSHQK
jgi:CHAD domain-containing protein